MEISSIEKIGNAFFRDKLKNYTKLGLPYCIYWGRAYDQFIKDQKGKTDQGIRHCKSVEHYVWVLLEKHLSSFSRESLYLLSLSSVFHDVAKISMNVHNHAQKAADIILEYLASRGYVNDKGTAMAVAYIVSSHDEGDFSHIPVEYPVGEEMNVFLRSLAAIFRMADMMDNCESRAVKLYKVFDIPPPQQDRFLNNVRDAIISTLPSRTDETVLEVQAYSTDVTTIRNVELYVKGLNAGVTPEHIQLLKNIQTRYIKRFRCYVESLSLPYKFSLKWVPFQPRLVSKRTDIIVPAFSEPAVTRPAACFFLNTKTNINIKKDLIDSIRNRKEIDAKYLYWSLSGTKNYLDLCRNPDYTLPYVAENLLRDKFRSEICPLIKRRSSRIDIIDLGPGYGEEPNIIINSFAQGMRDSDKINSILVDFSYHMLQLCVSYLDDVNLGKPNYRKNVSIISINSDFRDLQEFESIISDLAHTRLFVFLGGTMGNFFEKEILGVIRKMMKDSDYLLLGADLIGDLSDEDLKASYNSRYNQLFLFSPLAEIGFDIDDCRFECDIEEDISDVEESKTVCSYFYLPDGKKIRVIFSTKYDLQKLNAYLTTRSKLNIVKSVNTDDGGYSMLLLSKK